MDAITTIEEVSTKLTQTLWRKCFQGEAYLKEFDIILNQVLFLILSDNEWSLAKELGDYAFNVINTKNADYKMMFLVNYCIALNNLNDNPRVCELLSKVDFSIMDHEFVLAKHVLLNDVDNTIKYMKKIGTEGKYFRQDSYTTYPLFFEIKKDLRFKDAYKYLFGEDIDRKTIEQRIDETEKEIDCVDGDTDNESLIVT